MKSEVKKENGIQNDELLGPVLNAALIWREDQLRRS
jgi:hypothetical protein